MAQRLLLVSYDKQLHKCHLHDHEPKRVSIGGQWSDTITFHGLSDTIWVDWDGETCKVENKSLINGAISLQINNIPLEIYLTEHNDWHYYDISNKLNITFGKNTYDDVQIPNTAIDFVLFRDQLGDSFQMAVYQGTVFHNYTFVDGEEVKIEAGDELFCRCNGQSDQRSFGDIGLRTLYI